MNQVERVIHTLKQRIATGQWLPGERLATERQLAGELGVSTATVQRAMTQLQRDGLIEGRRGSGRFVSDAVSPPRTRELLVLIANPRHMFHPIMVTVGQGIAKVAEEHGYQLKYWATQQMDSSQPPESHAQAVGLEVNMAQFGRAEGMIVATQRVSREWLLAVSQKLPVVWMHAIAKPPRLTSVASDYLGGAYMAGRHLVSLHHRRIGAVVEQVTDWIAQSIAEGIRLSMLDLLRDGKGKLTLLRIDDTTSVEQGRQAARRWQAIDAAQRPTAMICGSDDLASGFYAQLMESGVRVPQDLSLLVLNDWPGTEQNPVSATSVNMRFEELGRLSTLQVIQMIERPDVYPEPRYVDCDLIVRDSTGRAPKG